ncbi:Neuroblast differentiation-associated protein AHNAK [Oryzias melastigma]|uniref:Neuroblast differentiation-associated protein AHNAK n=1 Tax=Oryzias melastigma TaxID=30732 RepID=A0A834BZ34_ORYME|nr:Neuroblast differentiation-associated protein AHNAK [Oryzias melastigma]
MKASDIDVTPPKADLNGPKVDIKAPEADMGKIKLPKINLPKFGGSGPKVTAPEVDANITTPDLDLSLPRADAKLPEANFTAPDVSFTTPNLNFSPPQIKGEVSQPDLNVGADLKGGPTLSTPALDLKSADLNLKAPNLDVSSPDISGNLSAPSIDAKMQKKELKAPDVTVNLQMPTLGLPKADIKGPDAHLKEPEVEVDATLGDFKLPHFNHPYIDLSIPSVLASGDAKLEAPKVSIETPNTSDPALELSAPKLEGAKVDTEVPNVDVSVEKSKTPLFSLPKLNLFGSKSKSPEVDASADLGKEDAHLETEDSNAEIPMFRPHKLPKNTIGSIGEMFQSTLFKADADEKEYVVSKGVKLPIINATAKPGENISVMDMLKSSKEKRNASPSDGKTDADLNITAPSLDIKASTETKDAPLVRGGTFKVEKPESSLNLTAPEILPEKFELGLSNMLGLNVKDSDDN